MFSNRPFECSILCCMLLPVQGYDQLLLLQDGTTAKQGKKGVAGGARMAEPDQGEEAAPEEVPGAVIAASEVPQQKKQKTDKSAGKC